MSVRTLILAAGEGTRWALHTGVPKHLVEVEGERLLDRTVGQFAQLGDVEIIAPADHRYTNPAARTIPAQLNPRNFEADRFASSRHRWDPAATMVLAFGDVWFSPEAIEAVDGVAGYGWAWVARFGPSELTGCPNGEGFALVVAPDAQPLVLGNLDLLIARRRSGAITRAVGWDLYRLLEGLPLDQHQAGPNLVEVDDWTDDFDYPHDFDRWTARRAEL